MDETLIPLCDEASLVEDEGIRIELPDRPAVAVFLHEERIHVTDDQCTHGPASLSDGLCENGQIECPFHMGRFDLATGVATHSPCQVPVAVHIVRLIDGVVHIVA